MKTLQNSIKIIFKEINIGQEILIALTGGILVTGYTLTFSQQEKNYLLYGLPWGFIKRIETGEIKIIYSALFYNIFLYSIIVFVLLIGINYLRTKKRGETMTSKSLPSKKF